MNIPIPMLLVRAWDRLGQWGNVPVIWDLRRMDHQRRGVDGVLPAAPQKTHTTTRYADTRARARARKQHCRHPHHCSFTRQAADRANPFHGLQGLQHLVGSVAGAPVGQGPRRASTDCGGAGQAVDQHVEPSNRKRAGPPRPHHHHPLRSHDEGEDEERRGAGRQGRAPTQSTAGGETQ